MPFARSELELEGELNRARPADLVERAEAAIGAAGAEATGKRLCRVTEKWASQAVGGRAEIRMVEEVEELRAETKPNFLCEMKLALEGNIRLRSPKAAQHIAAEIPLRPLGGATPCADLI